MNTWTDTKEAVVTGTVREPRDEHGRPEALVVCYDLAKRNQLEGWLESAGFTASGCPGPGAPASCPQVHGSACPLATTADVVVLDLALLGSYDAASVPGWVLLDTYLERGSQVVALVDPGDDPPVLHAMPSVFLPRGASRELLLAAVRAALGTRT